MTTLAELVLEWAAAAGIESPELETIDGSGESLLTTSAPGENGEYVVHVCVDHDKDLLQALVGPSASVPEARRREVAEFFARVNSSLETGKLMISHEHGGVLCCATIPAANTQVPVGLLDNLVHACVNELDSLQPLLQQVAFGEISGADAAQRFVEREAGIAPAVVPEPVEEPVVLEYEDLDGAAALAARAAAHAGFQFLRLPEQQVCSGELPFRAHFHSLAPVIVFAEPGSWLYRADDEAEREPSSGQRHQHLITARRLRDFDIEKPVIVVTAAADLARLAPLYLNRGLFDRQISLPPPAKEVVAREWMASLGEALCGASLTQNLDKLGAMLRRDYDDRAQRELLVLQLRRKARRTGKPVEFSDVIDMAIRGGVERGQSLNATSAAERRITAVHEAGHAAVSIIDSAGQNVPDYVTSVSGRGFEGIAIGSYRYAEAHGNEMTLRDLRHKVRTLLAGRAAEEIVFGVEAAGSGAASDLEKATRLVLRAVALWGFAPDMDAEGVSGSNLAVVIDSPDSADTQRIYPMTRAFLAQEFAVTRRLLLEHRVLLDAITERLLVDPLLDQQDLQQLCSSCGVAYPVD